LNYENSRRVVDFLSLSFAVDSIGLEIGSLIMSDPSLSFLVSFPSRKCTELRRELAKSEFSDIRISQHC
jgi:hypothetical protein